jgi:hypothetical protein
MHSRNWDQTEKPWKQILKHTDKIDRQLFSTVINIGDGENTPFWEASG